MDIEKTRLLLDSISATFGVEPHTIQYILEKELSLQYGSDIPATLLMDGRLLVYTENSGFKCVIPGAKTLEKTLKGIDKTLRELSIQNHMSRLNRNEKIGYGKIIKKLDKHNYEVMFFEGLEHGKAIDTKIFKGVFNSKKHGISSEIYQLGRHYVFKKLKISGNTIEVGRNTVDVITYELRNIQCKLENGLKKNIYLYIKYVDLRTNKIIVRHKKSGAHLMKLIDKKMKEKCRFALMLERSA